MIDLEFSSLPETIVTGGVEHKVHTSFRVWLRWGRLLKECHIAAPFIFKEEAPPPGSDWVEAALEFYRSDTATPNGTRKNVNPSMDLLLDGDYLVGSFQYAYGIDLTSEDMHWHRFLALLRSLPKDAKLSEIASYRTWQNDKRKHETIMRELRKEWALPSGRGAVIDEEQYDKNIKAHAEKLGIKV